MSMHKLSIIFGVLLILGCKKEDNAGEIIFGTECLNGFQMPYANEQSVTNFVELETSDFGDMRLVSGVNGDSLFSSVGQTVTTSSPSLVLNGPFPHRKLTLSIGSKNLYSGTNKIGDVAFFVEKLSKNPDTSLESQIDSAFKVGSLPLSKTRFSLDSTLKNDENFFFTVCIADCKVKGSWLAGLSNLPEQNGVLHCSRFKKLPETDSIRYQIDLSFDKITIESHARFELNDGKMVLDFKVPR